MGGFGNVLYQLFAARLIEEMGVKVSIIDDLTRPGMFQKLARWRIHGDEYKPYLLQGRTQGHGGMLPVFCGLLSKKLGARFGDYAAFLEDVPTAPETLPSHVFGYFQDRNIIARHNKAFQSFCTDLGGRFEAMVQSQEPADAVLHLRSKENPWAAANGSVYQDILDRFQGQKVLIITDDLESISQYDLQAKLTNTMLVRKSDNFLEDFVAILSAKTFIAGPSTMSWWGAHLSSQLETLWMPAFLIDRLGLYLPKGVEVNTI